MHIFILGAGPAGLAAALALSQISHLHPILHITVLESRPKVQTLGGTIALTPLALRYLDALGIGARLRTLGLQLRGIDVVAHRNGRVLGQMFRGTDVLRVKRHVLVQCMVDAVAQLPKDQVTVWYGARVKDIRQVDDEGKVYVDVDFDYEGTMETLTCDLLLGCDGIHSFVRSKFVDPDREKEYSGRAIAYGYFKSAEPGRIPVTTSDEAPVLRDSTMIHGQHGSFLMTYFEPSRETVYVVAILPMTENKEAREGWLAVGDNKAALKRNITARFQGGAIRGLAYVIEACEWYFYPVYMLPPIGKWSEGRVLLLGDAAHAMPPQGESTGIAIEDAVLFAHVMSNEVSKGIPRVLTTYESLRRNEIKSLYAETMFRWNASSASSWLWSVIMEFVTWVYIIWHNFRQEAYFRRDVRKFKLH